MWVGLIMDLEGALLGDSWTFLRRSTAFRDSLSTSFDLSRKKNGDKHKFILSITPNQLILKDIMYSGGIQTTDIKNL